MRRYLLWLIPAFCVAAGLWWDLGHGQAWMATWTGTDNCVNVPAHYLQVCKHYGFWSGFGSVIPWALFSMGGIFAGVTLAFRHTNCHEKGCWRIGKYQLAGGEFKVCRYHHPDLKGEHPTLDHMRLRHRQHQEATTCQHESHGKASGPAEDAAATR
jgi:hypothetical protein